MPNSQKKSKGKKNLEWFQENGVFSRAKTKAEKKEIHSLRRVARGRCPYACSFVPHPSKLNIMFCEGCGFKQRPKQLLLYNKRRRTFRMKENLNSLVCPISAESETALQQLRQQYGIYTNTATTHITFAEGLRPDLDRQYQRRQLIVNLARALHQSASALTPTRIHLVPTHNGEDRNLVLLQLQIDDNANSALLPIHQQCRLPQYPLHCTLGTLPTKRAEQMKRNINHQPGVDKTFPPHPILLPPRGLQLDLRYLQELVPVGHYMKEAHNIGQPKEENIWSEVQQQQHQQQSAEEPKPPPVYKRTSEYSLFRQSVEEPKPPPVYERTSEYSLIRIAERNNNLEILPKRNA